MARYYLDTGAVVGLTFIHDRWRNEAERLFETENSLYLTRPVIYEYCNSTRNNNLETANVDWKSTDGLFEKKLLKPSAAQANLGPVVQNYTDDVDIDALVSDIVEAGKLDEDIDEEVFESEVRPNIREFIEAQVGDKDLTPKVAREVMRTLRSTIEARAKKKKEEIKNRVTVEFVPSERDEHRDTFHYVEGYVDKIILCDATWMENQNILSRVITTDKSHLYCNRDRIGADAGLAVLYLKDEFADASVES